MKITDLALIFIVIMLPIVIIVYVNTAFVVKAEKQEMYYKNLMNAAIADGVTAMKEVENVNTDIDYGYSGDTDNKVSVNAKVAVDTFYSSLFNNFNIKGNNNSEINLKNYIPAIAVIDYNGVYINSAEKVGDKTEWTIKPKKTFTYTYFINRVDATKNYEMKLLQNVLQSDIEKIKYNGKYGECYNIYEVNFTMDDTIILNTIQIRLTDNKISNTTKTIFYLEDSNNNKVLTGENIEGNTLFSDAQITIDGITMPLVDGIVKYLKQIKGSVISNIVNDEMTYYINAHNRYAKEAGIAYNFYMPADQYDDQFDNINGIGMIAFIQGINLGNRMLNYKAYSLSDLSLVTKYFLSVPIDKDLAESDTVKASFKKKKLYHLSKDCPVYKAYLDANPSAEDRIKPEFLYKREEAATAGHYPCPVCRP